ncbi:N-carbamoylputrescine amidase [Treponema sp.]
MRKISVAAIQMACSEDREENIAKAENYVRRAAIQGANIILLQELFETPYFCQKEKPEYFALASSLATNPAVKRLGELARELGIVIPVSFFELSGQARYNSIAVIDIDGTVLGTYRKSHIPDGPGYEEKYYFNPGDLGVKVWKTKFGCIGIGICWDQWYPELARAMVLQGAELLFYPTAIGTEPQDASLDSMEHWRIVQRGHAGANLVPVIVANRIGTEKIDDSSITFYGSSFIADETGALVESADKSSEAMLIHEFDLDAIAIKRAAWGIFRDRRPDVYGSLLSYDGKNRHLGAGGN